VISPRRLSSRRSPSCSSRPPLCSGLWPIWSDSAVHGCIAGSSAAVPEVQDLCTYTCFMTIIVHNFNVQAKCFKTRDLYKTGPNRQARGPVYGHSCHAGSHPDTLSCPPQFHQMLEVLNLPHGQASGYALMCSASCISCKKPPGNTHSFATNAWHARPSAQVI